MKWGPCRILAQSLFVEPATREFPVEFRQVVLRVEVALFLFLVRRREVLGAPQVLLHVGDETAGVFIASVL
jgi:hypothetical protein